MIIKNLTRKQGTGQLLRYVFRYVFNPNKQPISAKNPFIIRHNIRKNSIEGYIAEFENNFANRRRKAKNQVRLHHTILSWHKADSQFITDRKLKALVREYIRLRGETNLYVGTKHEDRSHCHIHLVMSSHQLNGQSSRISKNEFENLKLQLDSYQREHFPELTHSLPQHGKSKIKNKEMGMLRKIKSLRDRANQRQREIDVHQHTKDFEETKQFMITKSAYRQGDMQSCKL
jgi:hypothetical protein